MNVAVVGSRTFTDYELLKNTLENYVTGSDRIVSGGAKGTDSLAELFSRKELNKEPVVFEADWDKYGKSAGFKRNTTIVENSDIVIAFWNGQSSGTKDTIDKAQKHHKPLIVVDV